MFTKSQKPQTNPKGMTTMDPKFSSQSAKADVPLSVLAANFRLSGDLDNDGDLQIDGSIEGNVRSNILTIGESGHVIGSIEAEEAAISGSVNGNITARRIVLHPSAKIQGDILYELLQVHEGAQINGQLKHKNYNQSSTKSPKTDESASVGSSSAVASTATTSSKKA